MLTLSRTNFGGTSNINGSNFTRTMTLPYESNLHRFSMRNFSPVTAQGFLTEQDVERVLDRLKQLPNYKPKSYGWLFALIPLAIVLSVGLYLYLLLKDIGKEDGEVNFTVIMAGPWIMVFVIITTVFGVIYLFQKCQQDNLRERQLAFELVIKEENQNFSPRGVRFVVGPRCSYLQIQLNGQRRGNDFRPISINQPGYSASVQPPIMNFEVSQNLISTGIPRVVPVEPFRPHTNRVDYPKIEEITVMK